METINIEKTRITPLVILDVEHEEFLIEGVSMPENPLAFYDPILAWFDEYGQNPIEGGKIKIQLDYFNTATSKIILSILDKVKKMGANNTVIWLYQKDDEDMKEVGDDYKEIIGDIVQPIHYE